MSSGAASKVEHARPVAGLESSHQFVEKPRRFRLVPVRVQLVIVGRVKPGWKPVGTLRRDGPNRRQHHVTSLENVPVLNDGQSVAASPPPQAQRDATSTVAAFGVCRRYSVV